MDIKTWKYPDGKLGQIVIHEDILDKKMENGKLIYEKTGKKSQIVIFCTYNENNVLEKITLQNYQNLNFAKTWKIEYDHEYAFKIQKTKIQGNNIEKLLNEIENDRNSITMLFIHKLVDYAKKLENK